MPTQCGKTITLFPQPYKNCKKTGPGQAPGLFSQYPVRREWFRPKPPKCLLVVNKVCQWTKLMAALLSILNNVEGNSAKSNVFGSSKSWKAIAVEYLIFQKLFGLCGFNRSFSYFWFGMTYPYFVHWLNSEVLRTSKMSIEHVFTAYFHLALNEEPTSERRNPTDSLNVHCTTFFRQENKRCAAS